MSARRGSGGSGFGMVMLVVVMVVVLLLVARSWLAVAPEATAVTNPQITDPALVSTPGELPDLPEMQRKTDEHVKEAKNALDEIN